MGKGFSVRGKACRWQAFFPKKLRRSTICKRRFATLLSLATSAEYSRISPARKGVPASAGGTRSLGWVVFGSAGGAETSAGLSVGTSQGEETEGCAAFDTRPKGHSPLAHNNAP